MKKMTVIAMGAAIAIISLVAVIWAQKDTASPQVTAPAQPVPATQTSIKQGGSVTVPPLRAAPNHPPLQPTANGKKASTAQKPGMTPQVTTVPAATTPAQPVAAVVLPVIPDTLKQETQNRFQDQLSFPLTEEKMLAFARTAIKVEKANEKWDVQIAAAEQDSMAVEYNNFAVEEISNAMQAATGITTAEFNEMTQLTVKNPDFNRIYLAYRQLVETPVPGKAAAQSAMPVQSAAPAAPSLQTSSQSPAR